MSNKPNSITQNISGSQIYGGIQTVQGDSNKQVITANTDQTHHKTTYRKGSKQMPQ
jgi:hypothetical protein